MREFSTQLLELVDNGVLDARVVLGNVIANYMSEEDVKDFCQSEYEELFPDEDD